jgi:hypothetical protein
VEHGAAAVTEFGDRSGWIRLESIKKGAIGALISATVTSCSIALLELLGSEVGVSIAMGSSIVSTNSLCNSRVLLSTSDSMCSSILCPNLGSALLGLSSTMAV